MPVVVTGAAGFIGRVTVTALEARGHHVVGIDRRAWAPVPGETSLVAELSRPDDDVRAALAEADAVVHLAGCPGVRDTTRDVAFRRHRDNVVGGEVVLAATPARTPLVVASSSSVYGGTDGTRPSHEDDPVRPRGGYARSKVVLEQRCAARRGAGGLVGVVRPFTVAGEGQRPDMAIARWLAAALAGEEVVVLGSLDRVRDVTDVRDVAEGLVRAVERELDTTVNLGTGRSHTLGSLLDAVAAATGVRPRVRLRRAAAEEVPATRADVRRCAARLGFVPTTDVRALVARQLAATAAGVPVPDRSARSLPSPSALSPALEAAV